MIAVADDLCDDVARCHPRTDPKLFPMTPTVMVDRPGFPDLLVSVRVVLDGDGRPRGAVESIRRAPWAEPGGAMGWTDEAEKRAIRAAELRV